jgi:hypothetical protein
LLVLLLKNEKNKSRSPVSREPAPHKQPPSAALRNALCVAVETQNLAGERELTAWPSCSCPQW